MFFTTALLLAAGAVIAQDDPTVAWSLCLQDQMAIEAQVEPEPSLVLAVAFAECSQLEAQVRDWMVADVAAQTGDADTAERQGDIMMSSVRITLTEDLLAMARRLIAESQG